MQLSGAMEEAMVSLMSVKNCARASCTPAVVPVYLDEANCLEQLSSF